MTVVESVNGKSGVVTLGAAEVSAIPDSEAGAPNGVATLNSSGELPEGQLPSSVVSESAANAPLSANGAQIVNVPAWQPEQLYPANYLVQHEERLWIRGSAGVSAKTWTEDDVHWTGGISWPTGTQEKGAIPVAESSTGRQVFLDVGGRGAYVRCNPTAPLGVEWVAATVFDVTAYDVVCDSKTDNYTALQEVVTAATQVNQGVAVLYFPPGGAAASSPARPRRTTISSPASARRTSLEK